MIFHEYYTKIPDAELARFVESQELGRLITVGADGTPHIGLYPFVRAGSVIDLHLVQADEQIADLEARPRCVFEVDIVLGAPGVRRLGDRLPPDGDLRMREHRHAGAGGRRRPAGPAARALSAGRQVSLARP